MGWNHQPGHLNTKQITTAIYPKPKGEEHDFFEAKGTWYHGILFEALSSIYLNPWKSQ